MTPDMHITIIAFNGSVGGPELTRCEMPFIKDEILREIADDLLRVIDVVPLDYRARIREAVHIASCEYGLKLNLVQARLIVKIADCAWREVVFQTKKIVDGN